MKPKETPKEIAKKLLPLIGGEPKVVIYDDAAGMNRVAIGEYGKKGESRVFDNRVVREEVRNSVGGVRIRFRGIAGMASSDCRDDADMAERPYD